MVKTDLKDTYFIIPIHPNHQKFLSFVVDNQEFGLSCSLWAFTRIMNPVVILLMSMGFRVIIYINDMLVMGELSVIAPPNAWKC